MVADSIQVCWWRLEEVGKKIWRPILMQFIMTINTLSALPDGLEEQIFHLGSPCFADWINYDSWIVKSHVTRWHWGQLLSSSESIPWCEMQPFEVLCHHFDVVKQNFKKTCVAYWMWWRVSSRGRNVCGASEASKTTLEDNWQSTVLQRTRGFGIGLANSLASLNLWLNCHNLEWMENLV